MVICHGMADRREITIRNARIEVEAPFLEEIVHALGRIEGLSHEKKLGRWIGRMDDLWLLRALYEVSEPLGIQITASVETQKGRLEARLAQEMAAAEAEDGHLEVPRLNGTPYPYQRAGASYAMGHPQVLIADDMGLGKTLQALMTLELRDAYPAVVVCPAIVKDVWQREVEKWLPHREIIVLAGRKLITHGGPRRPDVVILNYDIVIYRWHGIRRAFTPKAVVFDESHYLKNPKAKRTKACLSLAHGIDCRIGLSGTPVLNRPAELPSQLRVLDLLHHFGGTMKFLHRYTNVRWNGFANEYVGGRNLGELHERLKMYGYIRRSKKAVLPDLPDKTYSQQAVRISNPVTYRKAERDVIDYIGATAEKDREFLESISGESKTVQKKLIAAHRNTAEYRARKAEQLVRMATLRRLVAEGKIAPAQDWIENFLLSGEKLVVFAHHVEVLDKLSHYFEAPVIKGGLTDAQRKRAQEQFIDGDVPVLFIGMKAGGVGLDGLQKAASNVLFIELAWTPADHSQAEDRLHRIGQGSKVSVWYILGESTIDEFVFQMLMGKTALIDATLGGSVGTKSESVFRQVLDELGKRGTHA
jgi:SNF2 family DNA or RNA helicase